MRRRNHPLSWDRRRLIRRDSVYHTPADPCLPDCSIFLHTYLNYWNCGITIFHWFIDASPRLSRSPLLPRLCLLSRFRFLCIPFAPSPLFALASSARQLYFHHPRYSKKKIRKEPWDPPTVGFYYPPSLLFIYRTCITRMSHSRRWI